MKIKLGVIFGGRSGEHEIALRSARTVIEHADPEKYEIIPLAITNDGRWLSPRDSLALLPSSTRELFSGRYGEPSTIRGTLTGDGSMGGLINASKSQSELDTAPSASTSGTPIPLDVVFPVLHGTYGEDGTIQGLLDMAGLPYVGCGVLASSTGMDKIVMKHLFEQAGLKVAKYDWFQRSAWETGPQPIISRIARTLGFPVFVKPANLGSSVGISKADDKDELRDAVNDAARYDRRIIVERAVVGREIEVSVLGNEHPIASLPGEIIVGHDFYDYEDKYIDNASRTEVPARLPKKTAERLQRDAITAFRAIDGSGLARVDFFVERGRVIINEINTMPGFTSISMYPKLWEASGISYSELIDRLIELAIERHSDKARNLTSYQPRE